MKNILLLSILLCAAFIGNAQKADKTISKAIFSAMDARVQEDIDKNMDDALEDLNKILLKEEENAVAHFGLSVVYSYDEYTSRDYFKAWKHFQEAYKNQSQITPDEITVLNEYFFKQDKKRRNRPLNKNMDWEKRIVEEKLIKFVREENKVEFATKFLNEFSDSKYVENVEHIRTYIDYRNAENTNTVEAYNAFLKQYPEAAQKDLAINKRNKVAFKKAVGLNSLSALRAFVKEYPEAVEVEEAKKLMSVMAYEEAAKARSLELLEQFMVDYPNSAKMPDARVLKKELLFEWAKSVNTIEAYNKFVALYPEGSYYVDIFNLKAKALGQQLLMDFPMENYKFIKAFDNQEISDFGGSVISKSNGDLVVVANSKTSADQMYDTWLLGLNAEGKMVWNSFLGNEFDDFAKQVVVNQDSEIYVAGITNAIKDSINGQSWLYKLAPDGSNIFNTKLEGEGILGLGVYADGSSIVSSYILSDDGTHVPLIIKINKNGKKLWSRTYSSSGKGYALVLSQNTAYLSTGGWICAIDENGYLIWDQFLTEGQFITAVGSTNDGGAIYAGKKGQEGYAIAFNSSGEKLWEQTYALNSIGKFENVTVLGDGSALISGTIGNGIYVNKVGSDGSLLKTSNFNLPEGISLNGIAVSEGNTVVISGTRKGKQSDIVVFKLSF